MRDKRCIALTDNVKCEVRRDQTQGRITLCTPCSVLRTPRPSPLAFCASSFILLAVLLLVLVASRPAAGSKAPGPTIHGDWSEPLWSQRPTTEADRDRVEALAILVAGAAHQQKEEYAEALRCCQRSWRLYPQPSTIGRAIIPLAVRLHRYAEAARYALKTADADGADHNLLRQLGAFLRSRGIGSMPWPSTKRRWPRGAKPRKPPPMFSGGWSWAGST